MKKLFTLIMVIFITFSAFSQSPEKMSYQCVVRNPSGVLVTNQSVGIRTTILQGTPSGTVIYQETYSPNPQTNANGLVTIEIGGGFPITGTFASINWASGPYFLRTETDPTGGTSYTISGTSQLLSVPYSFYSNMSADIANNSVTSDKIVDGAIGSVDLGNNSVNSSKIADNSILTADLTNNVVTSSKIENLAVTEDKLAGSAVTMSKIANSAVTTDKLAAGSVTTDKINNGAVTGVKLAQQGAASGQVLKWTGTTWAPGNDVEGGLSLPYSATVAHTNYAFQITNSSNSGIYGYSSAASGTYFGLYGQSDGTGGRGVWGYSTSSTGSTVGVGAGVISSQGKAIQAIASSATGTTYGVHSAVSSADGFSGYFSGGKFYVSGNVGIGTTTPSTKLDVEGTVNVGGGNTSELNRDQTGSANLAPIAYGVISGAGTIHTVGSTTNFTVTHISTGVYDILINGEVFSYYNNCASATLIGPGPGFIIAGSANNSLRISVYTTGGAAMDRAFYFVAYKP